MANASVRGALLPILPLLAALCWLGNIIALLAIWIARGAPQYKTGDGAVVYISDVGADIKPLFISLCCLTSLFYLCTLLALYLLRRRSGNDVPWDTTKVQRIAAALTILFAVAGCTALILLSIFDAHNYNSLHWIFTLCFIASICVSIFFNVVEVRGLKEAWGRRHLRISAGIKVFVAVLAGACTIAMVVLMSMCAGGPDDPVTPSCNTYESAAAVLEWVMAFLIALYFLSFIADLWPIAEEVLPDELGENDPTQQMEQGIGAGALPKAGVRVDSVVA